MRKIPNRVAPQGHIFHCGLGKFEYVAPELQGQSLATVVRTQDQDCFALAVLIFLLLMEGSHPFRGSGEPPELENRIQQGLYPYSLTRPVSSNPPRRGLPFNALHPGLQQQFEACFVAGHGDPARRPRAADWFNALNRAEDALRQCAVNSHHWYLSARQNCLWCERTRQFGGHDPFPPPPQPPPPKREVNGQRTYQGIQLRSKPMRVSSDEAQKVFGLDGNSRPLKYVAHDFEDGGEVVLDRATGLMWQKSGSWNSMTYQDTQAYINTLNTQQFAGYNDWRLPTIPELLSLVEPQKQSNDLYINPIFDDKTQYWCWSADRKDSSESVWGVSFLSGSARWSHLNYIYYACVRAVRS